MLGQLSFKTNLKSGADSILWIDGFANNFIKGGMCDNLGLNDKLSMRNLNLYPNPIHKSASDLLSLNINDNTEVLVYNLNGVLVSKSIGSKLNIQTLNNGIYLVKVGNAVGKVVILD